MLIRVLHVTREDGLGGAVRAARRVHSAQVDNGAELELQSRIRTLQRSRNDPTVIGGPPRGTSKAWSRLRPHLTDWTRRGFHTENPTLHSVAWPATGLGRELQERRREDVDIINLHWLGDATLSIEEIGRLPQPVVWRLADQWAFCGAEHYTALPGRGETESRDERYVAGYPESSRPATEGGPDLNRRTWLRKQRSWRRPMHIVCTSTWMASCARRSALMADWPISIIPNPLDVETFAPYDQHMARKAWRLPDDRPLILFGAAGGTRDVRKGADLLFEAMQFLKRRVAGSPLETLALVVFGQAAPAPPQDYGFPIHWIGEVTDDVSLRLLYAAADVMVVPSRLEAFGQTASEAQSCGTPVVAFRTGGLADIVADRSSGMLVPPFDTASLAAAVHWVIEDQGRRRLLSAAARQRAVSLFHPRLVAGQYRAVYEQAVAASARASARSG